jgi:hypothetical protein
MKTTDMTPGQLRTALKAHQAYMANLHAGLRYDVVRKAWIPQDEPTICELAMRSNTQKTKKV